MKPFRNEDIYVTNEAWSESQGWVNGSLKSANQLLSSFGFSIDNSDKCLESARD